MKDSPFQRFAQLLEEMCPGQAERGPWPDQPHLPALVRDFWTAVGLSQFSRKLAPGPERAEHARLEEAFELWFDHAATRDRWRIEPDDEPIPWRFLPTKPRLVGSMQDPYLIASDAEAHPALFLFYQRSPVGQRLEQSYLRYCCAWLLRAGTTRNSAGFSNGAVVEGPPAVEGLDSGISRLNPGVYLVERVDQHTSPTLAFRDLAAYGQFVLSRPAEQQRLFHVPKGSWIEVRPPKSLPIHPKEPKPAAGFFRHGPHALIGQLAGISVWIQSTMGTRSPDVRVICDPARAESVKNWLAERCKVVRTSSK